MERNKMLIILFMITSVMNYGQTSRMVEYPLLVLEEKVMTEDFVSIINDVNCLNLDTLYPDFVLTVHVSIPEMNFETNRVTAKFNFELVPFIIDRDSQRNYAGVLHFKNGYVFVAYSPNYFWVNSTDTSISFSQHEESYSNFHFIAQTISCQYELKGNRLKSNGFSCKCDLE